MHFPFRVPTKQVTGGQECGPPKKHFLRRGRGALRWCTDREKVRQREEKVTEGERVEADEGVNKSAKGTVRVRCGKGVGGKWNRVTQP
ncbi:hypothetical protein CEXT_5101 [Caerostris extrusa]|uniref:Uncharacterized protein n=1 Tax=Caerostris extrusa TaxID=172846 RepID=A0AAV4WMD5_CAEEX|nr:hypothetical protein CEXT_5101 [Caerostris extrusa]